MQVPRFREFCNYMICELRIHEWLGLFSLYTGWLSLHGIDSALLVDVEWTMYYEDFFKRFASRLFIRCNFMNGLFLVLGKVSFQSMTIPLVFPSVLVIAVFQIFIINSPVARERLTERNLISTAWSRMTWSLSHGHGRLGS